MSKRSAEDDGNPTNKYLCLGKSIRESEKVIIKLSLLFPEEKFFQRVPRIVMKHMIYSCIPNITQVDREIVSHSL